MSRYKWRAAILLFCLVSCSAANQRYHTLGPIDSTECEVEGEAGLQVSLDLNGDDLSDFVMLARVGDRGSKKLHDGKSYTNVTVVLLAFLSATNGQYTFHQIEAFESLEPVQVFVSRAVPSQYRELPTAKRTEIKSEAIELTFCGKSARLYFWDGQGFKAIPISD